MHRRLYEYERARRPWLCTPCSTSVGARFRGAGITVIDADQIARQAVAPGTSGLAEIMKHFGRDVLRPDGTLDRTKLGVIVFGNEEKRKH